jgi:hypothetical protein
MPKQVNIVEEILNINKFIDEERVRWASVRTEKLSITETQRDDLLVAYLDSLTALQSKVCCLISQVLAAPLNGNILRICPSTYRTQEEQTASTYEQLGVSRQEDEN